MAGPPGFKPTDEQRKIVLNAAMNGLNHTIIGKLLGISHNTVLKYFHDEIELGQENRLVEATNILWEKVKAGDTTSLIFFLKTKGKWSTVHDVNLGNKPGETFKTELDVSNLTEDQLRAIAAIKLGGE